MDTCAWEDHKYWWEVSFDEGVMDVVAYDASRARGGIRSDLVIDDTINPADVTSIEFIHNDEGVESPARSYPKGCSYIILRCRNPTYGEWEYKWRMDDMDGGTPERLVEGLNAFLSTSKSQVVPKQLADLQKFAYVERWGQGYVEYQPVSEAEPGQGATAHFEFTSVKKRNSSMPLWLFQTIVVVGVVASILLGIALSILLDDDGANEYDPSIWRDSGGYIGWALMRIAPVRAIVCILCVGMAFIVLAMFLSFLWGRFLLWRGSGTPIGTEVWIEGSTIRVAHKDPASDAQGSPLVLQLGYIDSVSYVDSHKNGWIEIKYRSSEIKYRSSYGGDRRTELWGLDLVDDDTRRQLLTCMDKYSLKYFRKSIFW